MLEVEAGDPYTRASELFAEILISVRAAARKRPLVRAMAPPMFDSWTRGAATWIFLHRHGDLPLPKESGPEVARRLDNDDGEFWYFVREFSKLPTESDS